MAWFLRRVPLWVAFAMAALTASELEVRSEPTVPLINSWLEREDRQAVATVLLIALAFGLTLLVVTAIWGYLLNALPGRIKLPLGLELDWTPEDARALREIDEKQQRDLDEAVRLVRDLAQRVKKLERAAKA